MKFQETETVELKKSTSELKEAVTTPTCDFYCGKILKGLLDVPVYFENDQVFAFHHTNPLWENHVVLLPKRHIESLLTLEEADNELLLELMRTAKMIAGDFMNRFGAARVYTNLGEYQSSKHLHWHIGCGKQLRPYLRHVLILKQAIISQ